MCMATGSPVKSVNPAADPYPTSTCRIEVSVSNTMPPPIVFPEPLLLVAAGTSLLGLKPTATSVPGGERAKWICAACVDRVPATSKTSAFFMGVFPFLLITRFGSDGTQPEYRTKTRVAQVRIATYAAVTGSIHKGDDALIRMVVVARGA